jgi:hypothetical protein
MAQQTPVTPQRPRVALLVALVALALSACSAPPDGTGGDRANATGGAGESASATGGAIELAVADICTTASDPQCVSRLVIRIGGEPKSAVTVMQALDVRHAQIVLSPEDSAEDVVEEISRG